MRSMRSICTLLFAIVLSVPLASFAGVFVSVNIAPPPLRVYEQPVCPGDGYIWTPGYWAYGPAGYYWVDGAWVLAPQPGLLWTPGYWGFSGGVYAWHAGYWGPHVGFYGGVHYGFGYDGVGFVGGRWDHGHFFYNTAVARVNVAVIHNTYRTEVINRNVTRVSFNGPGGIDRRPTPEQERFDHERHFERTNAQVEREHVASTRHENFAPRHDVPRPENRPMAMHNNNPHNNNMDRPRGNMNQPHGNMDHPHGNMNQPHGNMDHPHPDEHHGNMGNDHPHNGGERPGGDHHNDNHHEERNQR